MESSEESAMPKYPHATPEQAVSDMHLYEIIMIALGVVGVLVGILAAVSALDGNAFSVGLMWFCMIAVIASEIMAIRGIFVRSKKVSLIIWSTLNAIPALFAANNILSTILTFFFALLHIGE